MEIPVQSPTSNCRSNRPWPRLSDFLETSHFEHKTDRQYSQAQIGVKT